MKRIIPLLRHLMRPAMAICLSCLLAGPLLAAEGAGEMKLQKARAALTGESKDTIQAKKLLLDIVENDKDTLDSMSLCYVYVYLGYIEDRAGNRNEALPWYQKALEIKNADRVRECATYGLEKPLTWIRHLDEGAGEVSLKSAPPVVVRTVPVAGATNVDPALAEIRVTYSKPMQDGTWSWSTWGEENYPETTGNPQYLSDGRTCVLPVNLKPGKFYAIWLNSDKFRNFMDAGGKPAVPYLLTFRTAEISSGAGEQRMKTLVEDFFAHNYRDITARDTLEWGQVNNDANGNLAIRYKYRAKIWDKDTVTNNQVFTFDPQGKFVSAKPVPTDNSPAQSYDVNKLVSQFPAGEDLSTPEAACAAWQRASARKDAPAISKLSWVKIDPAQEEKWYRDQEQKDPENLAIYLKALAESKVLVVQVWRGELANVVTFLSYPPGRGRSPYSSRTFGRINGEWKNLGEDRLPSLEAARENFENKKETLWRHFESIRRHNTSARGEAESDTYLSLLNDDQCHVLA